MFVFNNTKINNINWMKNLKELNASGNCGIDQLANQRLELIKLYATNNLKLMTLVG